MSEQQGEWQAWRDTLSGPSRVKVDADGVWVDEQWADAAILNEGASALAAAGTLARRAFYLADGMAWMLRLGYDAGASAELRAIHDALPPHLHTSDCDGCAAVQQKP